MPPVSTRRWNQRRLIVSDERRLAVSEEEVDEVTKEIYYELLKEARARIPSKGLEWIFSRMLRNGSDYAIFHGYYDWVTGPWLTHHDILFDLEREYGDV